MPYLKVRISKEMDNMLHRIANESLTSKSDVTRMLISLGFRASTVLMDGVPDGKEQHEFFRKLSTVMTAEGYEPPKKKV